MGWVSCNLIWNCDWSAIIVFQVCVWCDWDPLGICLSAKKPVALCYW